MQISLSAESFPPTLRVVLATGVLGGFTTYSTFNYETLDFFQRVLGSQGSRTSGSPYPGRT